MTPAPPPTAKPKGKGGNFITKKYGPFSGWVWLLMIGGTVGAWFLLKGKGGNEGGYGGPEVVSGAEGVSGPPSGAGAGAPSENASPGIMLDPAVLDEIRTIGADVSMMGKAMGTATGAWEDAAAQVVGRVQEMQDAQFAQVSDFGMGYGSGESSATVAATLGAPGKKPAQKNAIRWGGSVYGRGTGSVFIREQLRPAGVSPSTWAKRHPEAAAYLGIPKTSPAAKKAAPARSAPKPKAAPKRAPVKAPARVQSKVKPAPKAKAKPKKKVRR